MSETRAIELSEDRIPFDGIEEAIEELVEIYGGSVIARRERGRDFILPLRRGVATAGAVECTVSWAPDDERDATVTMTCNRDVDAPKFQRVLLLVTGLIGAVLFMLWPFFPGQKEYGTLAWIGGAVAIGVYIISLRRTSGGLAHDFLQRVAGRQRATSSGSTVDK
jgi:hypothetical protein